MKFTVFALLPLFFLPTLAFGEVSCADYAKASLAPMYYIRKSIPLSQARERAARIYIAEHTLADAKTMLDIFTEAYEGIIDTMKKRRLRPADLSNELIFDIGLKQYDRCANYLRGQDLNRLLN